MTAVDDLRHLIGQALQELDNDLAVLERFQHSAGVGDDVVDARTGRTVASTAHGYLLYLILGEIEPLDELNGDTT